MPRKVALSTGLSMKDTTSATLAAKAKPTSKSTRVMEKGLRPERKRSSGPLTRTTAATVAARPVAPTAAVNASSALVGWPLASCVHEEHDEQRRGNAGNDRDDGQLKAAILSRAAGEDDGQETDDADAGRRPEQYLGRAERRCAGHDLVGGSRSLRPADRGMGRKSDNHDRRDGDEDRLQDALDAAQDEPAIG